MSAPLFLEQGTWMEEWHQKLHNNTTPDDVGICEAYLAFLRSGGDNGAYWRVLSDHGISRARLEGFDRPIKCEPEDYPHMRGTLIGEFPSGICRVLAGWKSPPPHTQSRPPQS